MRLRKAARVILVGAPGVGKGTQSERLLQRFPQLQSISTGDLLRSNVRNRTPLGTAASFCFSMSAARLLTRALALGIKVESTMKSGGLVSDDLMMRLISNELYKRGWLFDEDRRPDIMTLASSATATEPAAAYDASPPVGAFMATPSLLDAARTPPQASDDPSASFILDGFPRTASQADTLDGLIPINLVVAIKTPFDVIMERISGRWVHAPSGRVYNTTFNAPRVEGHDDVTGEPLTKRADDSEEVYRARFRKFEETSLPLLEHYDRQGVLWEVEGLSSDEISPKLYSEFEKRFT